MDEEERNRCCLAILLTRVGADRLRHHFISKWDDAGTFMLWTDCAQNGRDLLTKFRPLPYERNRVRSGDTTRWDLSLLAKALRNTRPPLVTSKGLVKSLKCLIDTRNTVCHTPKGKITTAEFKKLWNAVCNALRVFGATKEEFKKVKRDVTLPLNELTSLMKQCAEQDDEILRRLNTIFTRLETLEQGQHEIKESQEEIKERQEKNKEEIKDMFKDELDQVKKMVGNLDASSTSQVQLSTEDVQMRSIYLKTSIKRQTEFQPKFISSLSIASAKTDEIFTNLMMQYGRRPLPKDTSRSEHLSEYSKLSKTPIERSQDIFIPQQKGKTHPKSILVTGKPGIGKSLFCQKLVRDWAADDLFEESRTKTHGFDFVYLLPFRQLNLIDKEQLTLRDFLNRCSLLDDHSNIDEPLFEYMIKHQEKVLFILDGYDEYKHRESITTDRVDQNHENNPRIAMPVDALLSKLLKGKVFGKAVVMVTSRQIESNELGGMNFDALVEINGFSPEQVEEFIGKFYQSNIQMKNDVLGHVRENEDLKSLAHVPMFCFLMCWCMEWHMEFKTDQDFPVNMTELYSEVLTIFELKHHSKSQYKTGEIPELLTEYPDVVKLTLEKLSKLAVETMKKKMFNFEEKELMNIGLSSEEIGDLKLSGLLTSGPGLRTSATTITRYYSFSHLTLHEYLTARWYVENRKVPSLDEIDSDEVFQFYSGLSAKAENGEELMEQLLLRISESRQPWPVDDPLRMLLVQLLYVYGDKGFGLEMIKKHFFRLLFCSDERVMPLYAGYLCMSKKDRNIYIFYLNLLNLFCETHNELVTNALIDKIMVYKLNFSFLSLHEIKRMIQICKPLTNSFCPITSLRYSVESEDLDFLCDALLSTNINELELNISDNNDEFMFMSKYIRKALLDTNSKVQTLILHFDMIENEPMLHNLKIFSEEVGRSKRDIKMKIYIEHYEYLLDISKMKQMCKSLTNSFSPITSLSCGLSLDSLDILCDALPLTKINELEISFYLTKDVDLMSLCKALLDTNSKVKNLILSFPNNNMYINDELVSKFLKKLTHFSQEVGTSKRDIDIKFDFCKSPLDVSQMKELCKALTFSFSPITSLSCCVTFGYTFDLLCNALPSTNINELQIEVALDFDLKSLYKALLNTNCKVKILIVEIIDWDELILNKVKHLQQEVGRSKADKNIEIIFNYGL